MKKIYDVIVAGAGPAGFVAAIAAARVGAETLLIERSDSILGNMTAGPLEAVMTFHDEKRQVVKGIPQEFIENCVQARGSCGHVPDTTGYASSITPFQTEICKYVGFEMLKQAGVNLLLQAEISQVEMCGSTLKAVHVLGKGEELILEAAQFVDCTGDGDLAAMAGCSFEKGNKKGKLQPMTSLLQLGGVDEMLLAKWVLDHPEEFRFFDGQMLDYIRERVDNKQNLVLHLWGFYSLLRDGFEQGRLSLRREEMHAITGYDPGEAILNFTRVQRDSLSMVERTKAQAETTKQAYELWLWMRENLEAFRDSWIIKIGRIGIREGRRISGHHCIRKEELEQGIGVEHSVGMGAFPMDIHSPDGGKMEFYRVSRGYQIPMESLISRDVGNLLMGGRCICCTHEAQASLRITTTAMVTGQAAGICAAIRASQKTLSHSLDYELIKRELEKQDVVLG